MQDLHRASHLRWQTAGVQMASRQIVGVLGGMGPLATVDFLTKVIALTPASCDQEHVPLIVHQVPQIPDRSTAILQGNDAPLSPMLSGLRRLAQAGADLAVIPCNSAHHWHQSLSSLQSLRILHIVDAVKQELEGRCLRRGRIAIMATRGTHRSGVYERRLGEHFGALLPIDEATQVLVDRSIAEVKAGQDVAAALSAQAAGERLLGQGADVLVLACTELPVALADSSLRESCVDSSLALARLCVAESMRQGADSGAA